MEIKGKLTGKASVWELEDGKLITYFTIVMNEKDPANGRRQQKNTTYLKCNYLFNPGAAEFLNEGILVELIGEMADDSLVNKNGVAKTKLTFKTSNIKILNISGKNSFKKYTTDIYFVN